MKLGKYTITVTEKGCWEDDGPRNSAGYPAHDKHRQDWIERFGPIPDGYHVHHKCGNKACRNTDHMRLLTRSDNVREGVTRKRGQMPWSRLRVERMLFDMVGENWDKARGVS